MVATDSEPSVGPSVVAAMIRSGMGSSSPDQSSRSSPSSVESWARVVRAILAFPVNWMSGNESAKNVVKGSPPSSSESQSSK